MSDDLHSAFEEAFLRRGENLRLTDNGSVTDIKTNEDGIIITKSTNVDEYLKRAKLERDNFKVSRNTQDHFTKVASIPRIMYDAIMDECDKLQITNKKDRQKYLLNKLKQPEFQVFLSLPANFIRG